MNLQKKYCIIHTHTRYLYIYIYIYKILAISPTLNQRHGFMKCVFKKGKLQMAAFLSVDVVDEFRSFYSVESPCETGSKRGFDIQYANVGR